MNLHKPFLHIEMNVKMGLIHFFLRYSEPTRPCRIVTYSSAITLKILDYAHNPGYSAIS
jgi:hypothetical protein